MADNNRTIEVDLILNDSDVVSKLSNLGVRFQRLGNQFNALGQAFYKIGELGGINKSINGVISNFTSGIKGKILPGLDDVIYRYDTLRTYSKRLAPLGIDTTQAQKSFDHLYDSVLGLPTAIADITDSARDFIYATGDLNYGQNIAEALNAFSVIGGGEKTSDAVQRIAKRMLANGKIRTQQYESFITQLGTALTFVGERFGYSTKQFGEFQTAIRENKIKGSDLIRAIVDTYNTNENVQNLLAEMKNTLDAGISNIRNAFTRGFTGIFQTFDKILGGAGQGDFAAYAKSFTTIIDGFFGGITKWATEHSTEILDFFNRIKQIDFKSVISSFLDANLKKLELQLKILETIVDRPKLLKLVTNAPLYGKVATSIGGFLSSIGRIFAGFTIYRTLGNGSRVLRGSQTLTSMFSMFAIPGQEIGKTLTALAQTGEFEKIVGLGGFIGSYNQHILNVSEQIVNMEGKLVKLNNKVRFSKLGYRAGQLALTAGFIGIVAEVVAVLKYIHGAEIEKADVGKIILIGGAVGALMFAFGKIERGLPRGIAMTKPINLIKRFGTLFADAALVAGFIALVGFAAKTMQTVHDTDITGADVGKVAAISGAITVLGGVLGAMSVFLGSITAGTGGIGGLAVLAGEGLVAGIEALIAGFVGIIKLTASSMKDIVSACKIIATADFSNKDKINTNISAIEEMLESMLPLMNKISKGKGMWQILKDKVAIGNIKTLTDVFKNFGTVMDTIDSLTKNKWLNNKEGREISRNVFKNTIDWLGLVINDIYDSLSSKKYERKGGTQKLSKNIADQANLIRSDLEAINPALKQLNTAANNILSINTNMEGFDNAKFKEVISKVSTAISDIEQEFYPEGANEPIGAKLAGLDMTSEGGSWDSLNRIVAGLYNMASNLSILSNFTYNTDTLFTTFDTVITKINEIDSEKTTSAKEKLDTLRQTVDNLSASLKAFTWQTFINNLKNPELANAVNVVVATIGLISNAINSIPTSKTITLDFNLQRALPGLPGNPFTEGERHAKGGVVGGVYRGKDTTPAMLTPGEFVIRRNVAKTLGYGVLNKLNNMDLTGAFSSLGFTPKLSYAKNSNNSYNNNASVVQNIYNAPQNYTQRRAGRFVKGLMR